MKILFLLVVLANVSLFMWEFKTGAFEPVNHTEQLAEDSRQQIRLVSELPEHAVDIAATNLITGPEAEAKSTQNALSPSVAETPKATLSLDSESGALSEDRREVELTEPASKKTPSEQQPEAKAPTPTLVAQPEAKKTQAPQVTPTDKAVSDQGGADSNPLPAQTHPIEKTDISKAATPVICYEAGPFTTKSAYQVWLRRLNVEQDAIKPVSRQGDVISSYQVYYPAAETLAESEANVQMLKAQGINDLLLLRNGEELGQISLGVFTTERRALAMQSELLAKGIRVEIKPRYKQKLLHYALITDKDDVMARLDVLKKNYPDMTIKKLSQCSSD